MPLLVPIWLQESHRQSVLHRMKNSKPRLLDPQQGCHLRKRFKNRNRMSFSLSNDNAGFEIIVCTSNLCDRLFPTAGYALNIHRMRTSPATFEAELFTHVSGHLWGLPQVDKLVIWERSCDTRLQDSWVTTSLLTGQKGIRMQYNVKFFESGWENRDSAGRGAMLVQAGRAFHVASHNR